jgi:ElaB/YqjD/DUF883 family membrane-anchored ribosome-binding protein
MEALQNLADHMIVERNTDDMRQEIDCTRSALADKVEALEDRVKDNVQTVEDSIQMATDAVATVRRTFDIKHQVEQHPWTMVGGCFLAGVAASNLFPRVLRRLRKAPDPSANGNSAAASLQVPPLPRGDEGGALPAVMRSRSGLLELFHDEIAKIQGMAIGYVIGLARDSIKQSVPQLASQIESVMNGVTTKLGGTPFQARAS